MTDMTPISDYDAAAREVHRAIYAFNGFYKPENIDVGDFHSFIVGWCMARGVPTPEAQDAAMEIYMRIDVSRPPEQT
jgi:hypothetical protein